MTKHISSLILLASLLLVFPLYADENTLDERVVDSANLFADIMDMPDNAIPEDLLAECSGVVIFPSVIKGGFIVGARYGKGVMLYRDEDTGEWSAPAFCTIKGLSYGLQIGGQAIELILVVNNKKGMESLLEDKVTIGGDISAAAGPVGRDAEASTDVNLKASIMSYSRSKGLFLGISLKGAVIKHEPKSNKSYYGTELTPEEILIENKVKPTSAGAELIKVLKKYSSL